MAQNRFTVQEGLLIQKAHLARWRAKLGRRCYKALVTHVKSCNSELTLNSTGYDVLRGDGLVRFIYNWNP